MITKFSISNNIFIKKIGYVLSKGITEPLSRRVNCRL